MALRDADKLTRIKRFYRKAAAGPAVGGYGVLLDGRAAKTPEGRPLTAPAEALARLLADEWGAQGEFIDFAAMPATRLAWTAIDRSADAAAALAAEVARYASTDTLSYPEESGGLAVRQAALWTPWRDWAAGELELRLEVAGGSLHHAQQPETMELARVLAFGLEPFTLTGLAFAAALYGSAVLAFAVQRRVLDGVEAFELSRLEEAFQAEQWGLDLEAEARTDALRTEAAMIDCWFAALSLPA